MAISLSNLKSRKQKSRKRVGRGDGSGRGTYSGRGLKGQRSRSGGRKNLKRRGLKQFLKQIPKSRGFRSINSSWQAVNIFNLEDKFEDGELINISKLLKEGLITSRKGKIKLLGHGELKKKFTVQIDGFSKSAENAIKKAGGRIQLTTENEKQSKRSLKEKKDGKEKKKL